jgi:hypothetical protein
MRDETVAAFAGPAGAALEGAVAAYRANGGARAVVVRTPDRASPDDLAAALATLRAVPRVDVLVLAGGDPAPGVLQAAAAWCRARRAMLVADPPAAWIGVAAALAGVAALPASPDLAVWFPRLRAPGGAATSGPAAAVAGIIARTDREHGVWTAPAGARARLAGDPEPAVAVGADDLAALAAAGVNVVRALPGQGTVSWGARTRAAAPGGDPEWRYVTVRRTVLAVERSIEEGLSWAVFEPNGEPLWARVRATAADILEDLRRRGAFAGNTPRDAWFARCDAGTMTRDDIQEGRLVCLVGVAPVRPAEFVISRIGRRVQPG